MFLPEPSSRFRGMHEVGLVNAVDYNVNVSLRKLVDVNESLTRAVAYANVLSIAREESDLFDESRHYLLKIFGARRIIQKRLE